MRGSIAIVIGIMLSSPFATRVTALRSVGPNPLRQGTHIIHHHDTLSATTFPEGPFHVFVSPSKGSDSGSNNGTSPQFPLATIPAALALVEQYRLHAPHPNEYVYVELFPEVHRAAEAPGRTIVVEGKVCNYFRDDHRLVFRTYHPASSTQQQQKLKRQRVGAPLVRAAISGGVSVTLQRMPGAKGNTFTTILPETVGPQPDTMLWQLHDASSGDRVPVESTETLQYLDRQGLGSHPPFSVQVTTPVEGSIRNAYIILFHRWTTSVNRISSYDADSQRIVLEGVPSDNFVASGNRYYLSNVIQGFNNATGTISKPPAPGTFLYHKLTRQIWYTPKDGAGAGAETLNVTVPSTDNIIHVSECSGVKFENIAIQHSGIDLDVCARQGCSGTQASTLNATGGAVLSTHSHHIELIHCDVHGTGNYAIYFTDGTTDARVISSEVYDLGTGGIRIGNEANKGRKRNDPLPFLTQRITVAGSRIHHGNYIVNFGDGIFVQVAAELNFLHNEIFDLSYSGIGLGWTWNDNVLSQNANITVAFNNIHDIGRGLLSEVGCQHNLGKVHGFGLIIDHNICSNVQSYDYEGYGFWTDGSSANVKITNNIAYHQKGLNYNAHFGTNVTIENNVFALPLTTIPTSYNVSGDGGGYFQANIRFFNNDDNMKILRNIMFLDNSTIKKFYTLQGNIQAFKNNATVDYNCYWNAAFSGSHANSTTEMVWPTSVTKNTTFAGWQSPPYNFDQHSLITDPMFTNVTGLDFSKMDPSSPCITELGFVPIDTSKIGPDGWQE